MVETQIDALKEGYAGLMNTLEMKVRLELREFRLRIEQLETNQQKLIEIMEKVIQNVS